MLKFALECYGWVALALPVYANVSWDSERPLNKPAHTGRASATQTRWIASLVGPAVYHTSSTVSRQRQPAARSVGVFYFNRPEQLE